MLRRALVFLAGTALIVTGIALVYPPAAFIVAGLAFCGLAVLLERSAARAEKATNR